MPNLNTFFFPPVSFSSCKTFGSGKGVGVGGTSGRSVANAAAIRGSPQKMWGLAAAEFSLHFGVLFKNTKKKKTSKVVDDLKAT